MRQMQVADLTASANKIDTRMGPIPGRSSDRIASELRWAAGELQRTTDLAPVRRFLIDALDALEVIDSEISLTGHLKEMVECALAARNAGFGGKPQGFVKPDSDRQIFFYEQDFYVLSNFSAFTLNWRGWRFDTSEAAYHWEKFAHMNEVEIVGGHECYPCYTIRFAPSAHAAFKIAEANKSARRSDWDDVKVNIMREILRAKANQHEYVRRKLLMTGDRELIEDSWRDDFWGWGPNRTGQNMLGKLWMEVRAELRS